MGRGASLLVLVFLLAAGPRGGPRRPDPSVRDAPPVGPLTTEQLAQWARPAVVVIHATSSTGHDALGSGFYADTSGLVLTNAHVVLAADTVTVRLEQSRGEIPARIVLLDLARDIALLRAPGPSKHTLPLSDSLPSVGAHVIAVGHPAGLEFTISDGIISALRTFSQGRRMLQATAPISPGSSGGPLMDDHGYVVGMTTLYLAEGQNLNFSVCASDLNAALSEARSNAAKRYPSRILPLSERSTASDVASLARTYRRARKLPIVRDILAQAPRAAAPDSLLLLEHAELAWTEERLVECQALADSLIRLFPTFAPGHQVAASLHRNRGDWVKVRVEAELALSLDPDEEYRAYSHADLAWAKLVLHAAPDEILNHVEEALNVDQGTDNTPLHVLRACLLSTLGDLAGAQQEAAFVLATWPDSASARRNLEKCLPRR